MNNRLPPQPRELIDRSRKVRFFFEGKPCQGYAGDTISSALWAQGVRVLGRSFKYHRARGIFSMADLDCNAMMESERETNIRGDITPIKEGMKVRAVNTWGGVKGDRLRFMDWFGAFTPVGFYYKAFHTPKKLFPFYENRIRAVAGLGRVNTAKRTPLSPKDYAFCDVLVVGAGPSGLSAALAAAHCGARVMLVDENPYAGGSLRYRRAEEDRLAELEKRVRSHARIELRLGTVAAGYYADHWVALADEKRLTKLRAQAVVFATGSYAQPAVFRNNDLPGVMLCDGALRLMRLYGVRPLSHPVVLTANQDGYEAAVDFLEAGISVAAIVDLREGGESGPLASRLEKEGTPILKGSTVYEAFPGPGKRSVKRVVVRPLSSEGEPLAGGAKKIPCDGVTVSVGWTPADGLLRQAHAQMVYNREIEQFLPQTLPNGIYAAGRVNGIYEWEDKLEDGRCAGLEAAEFLGFGKAGEAAARPRPSGPLRNHPYPVFHHPKGKNFIDLDEDVALKDIENACREGFDNPELLKRYTTVGMGPSQGKLSNLNALRVMARMRGERMDGKAITTARPFTRSVPLRHLAGRIFTAVRRTPTHAFHEKAGAKFMYAGNWMRPEYYRVEGKTREECIYEEARNVREKVGLIDLGTLGKIEASGPDVVEFMHRMYTGLFAKLKVGMTRYGAMCDESGVVINDGVMGRLAEDRYYLSTTTTGSDAVFQVMKRWVLEWGLDVVLVNATSHYLAMNLAGPLSREIMQRLTDVDLSYEAFPYLGLREGKVAGVPARLFRVGFVGEMGYEIHLLADGGPHAWNALMEAGKPFGVRPFGVEAQRMLRLEKGHIILGQDSDGLTQPYEVGMSWAVKMKKPFFLGQRSLVILRKKKLERQLVGFSLPAEYAGPLPKEANLVVEEGKIKGRVTSIGRSPALGRPIGLAYVGPEQKEPGTPIHIKLGDGALVEAVVEKTPFYDPDNLKQKPPA